MRRADWARLALIIAVFACMFALLVKESTDWTRARHERTKIVQTDQRQIVCITEWAHKLTEWASVIADADNPDALPPPRFNCGGA